MERKRCLACDLLFKPRPQVPHQSYCSAPSCQRERRRQWQRHKLQTDPDYQDNQARAQQAWSQRNPDYSRQYRDSHPEYVERNRNRQASLAFRSARTADWNTGCRRQHFSGMGCHRNAGKSLVRKRTGRDHLARTQAHMGWQKPYVVVADTGVRSTTTICAQRMGRGATA